MTVITNYLQNLIKWKKGQSFGKIEERSKRLDALIRNQQGQADNN